MGWGEVELRRGEWQLESQVYGDETECEQLFSLDLFGRM